MVRVFEFDEDKLLIYEAKSNLVFLMSRREFELLRDYLDAPDRGLFARTYAGDGGLLATFDDMLAVGLFVPGPWDKLFEPSDDNIGRLLDYNAENVFMRKFVLEITQDCNFRCSYCSNTIEQVWRHHQKHHMPESVARAAVDYYFGLFTGFLAKIPEGYRPAFLRHYAPTIGFYGGEPTMNWRVLTSTIDYFKSLPWESHGVDPASLEVTVNTNLSLINDDILKVLVGNGAMLFASLDGPASEHDKNRRDTVGRPTFERAYRNLMKIKEYDAAYFKEKVLILAVEADNHDKRLTHEFLDAIGCNVSYLGMSHYDCFVSDPENKLRWLTENERDVVAANVEKFDENPENEIADYTFATELKTDRPRIGNVANALATCPVGVDNLMVDVDGKFHICHKTDGSYPIGDVASGLDRDALHRFYADYASVSNQLECRKCWAFRSCGQCAAARLSGGAFHNPTRAECDYLRKVVEVRFKSFIGIYRRHESLLDDLKAYVNDPLRYKGVFDLKKVEWEKL